MSARKKLIITGPRSKRAMTTIEHAMQPGRMNAILHWSLPNLQGFSVEEPVVVDRHFMMVIHDGRGRTIVLDDPVDDFPSPMLLAKIMLFVG